jgi:cell division protein ZapA
MERRTVQLRVSGQTYRVVTTATDGDLKRFVGIIEGKVAEVNPHGRAMPPQALLLAALALAHDVEEARARADRIESRSRETISRLIERIDAALADDAMNEGEGGEALSESPAEPLP